MSDDSQLQRRLGFLKIDDSAVAALRSLEPTLRRELPRALDSFYEQVRVFPETRRFFEDETRLHGAKARQESHWSLIATGEFGAAYEQAVKDVGRTHARIGLEPRWYIGGYALLLDHLTRTLVEQAWPTGFGVRRSRATELAGQIGALIKAALLDMDLAISLYLEAAEEARLRTERETLERERASVAQTFGEALSRLAAGDLTCRIVGDIPAEYAQLGKDFNAAVAQLGAAMASISGSSDAIRAGAGEIAQASDDLSQRTEQQAASLEQTAAALEQLTATVRRSAEGARQASDLVSTARSEAEHSGAVVQQAMQAMGQIERSSVEIGQIIGVIDEIAFQTNLLALNAGVEAARAGDSGRGFAVVAQEVRALAQRSAEAAKEIKDLIATSSGQVEDGVRLVADTGGALSRIVERVTGIDTLVSEIAASAEEQSTGLHEVNTAVGQMDQVTQQNAAMVEQATAATHSLNAETGELARLIGGFRLAEDPRHKSLAKLNPVETPAAPSARDRLARFIAPAPRGGQALARRPADDV